MSRGLDKEQAAMNAGILNVAFSLSGQLLAKVGRMLILDVFNDWVPAVAPQSAIGQRSRFKADCPLTICRY